MIEERQVKIFVVDELRAKYRFYTRKAEDMELTAKLMREKALEFDQIASQIEGKLLHAKKDSGQNSTE